MDKHGQLPGKIPAETAMQGCRCGWLICHRKLLVKGKPCNELADSAIAEPAVLLWFWFTSLGVLWVTLQKKMWISNLTYIIGKQDPSKTLRVCLAIAERTNLALAHRLHPLFLPSEVIYISVLGGRIMAGCSHLLKGSHFN